MPYENRHTSNKNDLIALIDIFAPLLEDRIYCPQQNILSEIQIEICQFYDYLQPNHTDVYLLCQRKFYIVLVMDMPL